MSDFDTKEYRSRNRRQNLIAKRLRDTGDHKGAFALKIVDPRKGEYRRERIRINQIDINQSED